MPPKMPPTPISLKRPAPLTFETGPTTPRTPPSRSPTLNSTAIHTFPIPALPLTFGIELEFMLATTSALNRQNPFTVVADILNNSGGHAVAVMTDGLIEEDEATMYDTWRVIEDGSVNRTNNEILPPQVSTRSGARIADEGYRKFELTDRDWQIGGIEVTSRVLRAPDPTVHNPYASASMLEIRRYLDALNLGNTSSGQNFATYVNDACGLHVHVGVSQQPTLGATLPLALLQHLVYIIAQFEPIITSLHPADRRGLRKGYSSAYVGSNLMGLRQSRHVCAKATMPELSAIQDRIFADDMTVIGLGDIIGSDGGGRDRGYNGKYKFVSMARFYPAKQDSDEIDSAKVTPGGTVEFRQHEGSLDFENVSHWTVFVIKLVRAAERMAVQSKPASPATPESERSPMRMVRELETYLNQPFPRRQGGKYKVKCKNHLDETQRLFNLIGLTRQENTYWMDRYAALNPEEVVRAGDVLFESVEEDLCLLCAQEKRDSLPRKIVYSASSDTPESSDDTDEEGDEEEDDDVEDVAAGN